MSTKMKTKNYRFTLTISFWDCQQIIEVTGTGKTKNEAKSNWYLQRYQGNPPQGACLPSKKDIINLSMKKVIA